jgi:hypothetical protein
MNAAFPPSPGLPTEFLKKTEFDQVSLDGTVLKVTEKEIALSKTKTWSYDELGSRGINDMVKFAQCLGKGIPRVERIVVLKDRFKPPSLMKKKKG